MTGEAERLADKLERRVKLLREARDGTKEEARSPLATQMALAADVGWEIEHNLPLILRHLRAGSDAAVERAARDACRERCALKGEPPCWREDIGGGQLAPGCDWRDLARAAIRAAVEP